MANRAENAQEDRSKFFLDITGEVCPLTFVRTKLLIERMPPGETAEVLLKGAEPLRNVPRTLIDQGHEVLALVPVDASGGPDVVHRLRVRKGAGRRPL